MRTPGDYNIFFSDAQFSGKTKLAQEYAKQLADNSIVAQAEFRSIDVTFFAAGAFSNSEIRRSLDDCIGKAVLVDDSENLFYRQNDHGAVIQEWLAQALDRQDETRTVFIFMSKKSVPQTGVPDGLSELAARLQAVPCTSVAAWEEGTAIRNAEMAQRKKEHELNACPEYIVRKGLAKAIDVVHVRPKRRMPGIS